MSDAAPQVHLDGVRVRGRCLPVEAGEVLRFDGLPYAAPPVGARRFLPPEPPLPLADPFDATAPGPAAPQRRGRLLGSRPVGATDESCLHLNIATPGLDGARPVLVWIHGGGFVSGSASDPIHAGERLVARGDVVLVTLDYRLGALGFLHGAGGANLGLRDQLAALEWIARHVRAFGGDPDRVTLFGESAGAMCIRALMAVPSADALFHGAILQSGAGVTAAGIATADRVREAFADAVGSDDPDDWRNLDLEALLDAQDSTGRRIRAETGAGAWRPVVDGSFLTATGIEAQDRPVNRRRPVLMGMNADEQRLFVDPRGRMDRDAAVARLAAAVRPDVDGAGAATARATAVLDGYGRLLPDADDGDLLAAAETDRFYRLPMLDFCAAREAAGATTWQYLFTRPSPALRGRLGACHALEIPFVFGTLDAPGMARFAGDDDAGWRLSDRLMAAWTRFAHDGTPGADWPAWTRAGGAVRVLDEPPAIVRHPSADAVDLWRSIRGQAA